MHKLNTFGAYREMFSAQDFSENRVLFADEYIDGETHLITCRNCKTPRQHLIDGRGWMYLNCVCQEKAQQKIKTEDEVAKLAAKFRSSAFEGRSEYENFTFANSDDSSPEALKASKLYVEHFSENKSNGIGLMFWGNVGTGKTYLAAAIANAVIDKGKKVMVVTAAGIVRKAQARFNDTNPYEEYTHCDLIIFDDFGAERNTSTATESVCAFIDFCQSRKIPMIVTTNFTPQLMNEAKTADTEFARIADRLSATCYPVKVNGESHRERLKQNMCEIMRKQLKIGEKP